MKTRFLTSFTTLVIACIAHGWGISEDTAMELAHDSTTYLMNRQILQEVKKSALNPNPPLASGQYDATTIGSPPLYSTTAALAEKFPAEQRPEIEKIFQQLLAAYKRIAPQVGLHPYDLAGGIALFITSNYMAYSDLDVSNEIYKKVVLQIKHAISKNPGLKKLSKTEMGAIHERLVLLGMYMHGIQLALKQNPNPNHSQKMKAAAKDYLEKFLQVQIENVRVGSKGLLIR